MEANTEFLQHEHESLARHLAISGFPEWIYQNSPKAFAELSDLQQAEHEYDIKFMLHVAAACPDLSQSILERLLKRKLSQKQYYCALGYCMQLWPAACAPYGSFEDGRWVLQSREDVKRMSKLSYIVLCLLGIVYIILRYWNTQVGEAVPWYFQDEELFWRFREWYERNQMDTSKSYIKPPLPTESLIRQEIVDRILNIIRDWRIWFLSSLVVGGGVWYGLRRRSRRGDMSGPAAIPLLPPLPVTADAQDSKRIESEQQNISDAEISEEDVSKMERPRREPAEKEVSKTEPAKSNPTNPAIIVTQGKGEPSRSVTLS